MIQQIDDRVASGQWNLTTIENETRILDTDLAIRLGFDRPRDIRKLIERHAAALDALGARATVARVINGGRAVETWLNRKQAIFIAAKSETVAATELTIQIIEKFDAYERGYEIPKTFSAALRLAADQQDTIERQKAALAIAAPKVEAYDEFIDSDGLITIDEAAKALGVGSGQKLGAQLRQIGWMSKANRVNTPNATAMKADFMRVRPAPLPNGTVYMQPVLTPKGVAALRLAIRDGELFLHKIDRARLLPAGKA